MPFTKCESPAGTEEGMEKCTRYKFLLPFTEQPIVLDTISDPASAANSGLVKGKK